MRSENQAMNIVLQRQYDQYRLSIDNIELLRREFHDLKHYMIAIRSEQDPKKKEQYLLEMEEAIHTQEALTNTGNSVLDVVLTTKSTYCMQKHITFTCMADGKLISFYACQRYLLYLWKMHWTMQLNVFPSLMTLKSV